MGSSLVHGGLKKEGLLSRDVETSAQSGANVHTYTGRWMVRRHRARLIAAFLTFSVPHPDRGRGPQDAAAVGLSDAALLDEKFVEGGYRDDARSCAVAVAGTPGR
jgi:hypothetical protein